MHQSRIVNFGLMSLGRVSMHSQKAFPNRVEVRAEACCTFSSLQEVEKSKYWDFFEKSEQICEWSEVSYTWCTFQKRKFSVLKWNSKRTQPRLKTNWPFSMGNMSCCLGGGVPAYLPPLFLRTKQAMSATRVRSATAHMVPMNQPWLEKSLCGFTTARGRGRQRGKQLKDPFCTSAFFKHFPSSALPAPSFFYYLTENR